VLLILFSLFSLFSATYFKSASCLLYTAVDHKVIYDCQFETVVKE